MRVPPHRYRRLPNRSAPAGPYGLTTSSLALRAYNATGRKIEDQRHNRSLRSSPTRGLIGVGIKPISNRLLCPEVPVHGSRKGAAIYSLHQKYHRFSPLNTPCIARRDENPPQPTDLTSRQETAGHGPLRVPSVGLRRPGASEVLIRQRAQPPRFLTSIWLCSKILFLQSAP